MGKVNLGTYELRQLIDHVLSQPTDNGLSWLSTHIVNKPNLVSIELNKPTYTHTQIMFS